MSALINLNRAIPAWHICPYSTALCPALSPRNRPCTASPHIRDTSPSHPLRKLSVAFCYFSKALLKHIPPIFPLPPYTLHTQHTQHKSCRRLEGVRGGNPIASRRTHPSFSATPYNCILVWGRGIRNNAAPARQAVNCPCQPQPGGAYWL